MLDESRDPIDLPNMRVGYGGGIPPNIGEGDRAATLVLNADGLWYGTWETSETDDEGLPVYVIATAEPDALLAFTDPDGVEWARDDAASPWEPQEARA